MGVGERDGVIVGRVEDLSEDVAYLADAGKEAVAVPEAGTGAAEIEGGARMVDEDVTIPPECGVPEVLLVSLPARQEAFCPEGRIHA